MTPTENSEAERGEFRLVSSYDEPSRADRARLASSVFLVALGARILYTFALGWSEYRPLADAQDYNLIAQGIAGGEGFARLGHDFAWRATAFRPPLTPYLISAVYAVSPANVLAARILMCVIGAATAVLIFFITAAAFPGIRSWRTALLAGVMAALYPYLIIHSTALLIEPAHVLLVCALLLLMIRARKPLGALPLAAIGGVAGLIALNRPDGIAYAVLVALWAATLGSSPDTGHTSDEDATNPRRRRHGVHRIRAVGVVLGVFLIVMAPWWVRNYATFNAVIASTTSTGDLVLGANNATTYEPGVFYGYWSYQDVITGEAGAYVFADEVTADRKHLEMGLSYAADHPLGFVMVMPIRVLRGWELWDPIGNARFGTSWGRPMWMGRLALGVYYPVLAMAIFGAFCARRRWRELAPLYAVPIYVTLMFAFATGEMRYRAPVEVVLIVFAAHSWYLLVARFRRRFKLEADDAGDLGSGLTDELPTQAETTTF